MKPIKLRSYRNRYTIPIPDNMKQSMTIPSTVHTYSVGIEYMKNWFLEKFDKNYFGSRYRNIYLMNLKILHRLQIN